MFFTGESSFAQKDSLKDKIHVIHAEFLQFERIGNAENQYLKQDVVIRHKNTFLFCDSAAILGLYVKAIGHVRIVEGDSLQIYGDTLNYDGSRLNAELIDNVILNHHGKQLFTKKIFYDLKKRLASYSTDGLLIHNGTQMKSKRGYYFAKTEQAFFKDSVNILLDNGMNVQSDTIQFDSKNNKVIFLAPTNILQNDLKIFCDQGYYDIQNSTAYFDNHPTYKRKNEFAEAKIIINDEKQKLTKLYTNAVIKDSISEARGDTIIINNLDNTVKIFGNGFYKDKDRNIHGQKIEYNRSDKSLQVVGRTELTEGSQIITALKIEYIGHSDIGYAYGDVVVRDTQSGWEIHCDTFSYNKKNKKFTPYGSKKYIATPLDNDTLYLTAEEIFSEQHFEDKDSFQILIAQHDVRIWGKKIQGLCDSLFFNGKDSSFSMYRQPILWSDTTQFSADTILLHLKNNSLDKIDLLQNAFILTESQTQLYNQIKGRTIYAYFESKKLNHCDVFGNAETIYFVQDETKEYIGVNYIQCSKIKIDFLPDEKIDRIHFYNKPTGNLLPVSQGRDKRLDGFHSRWEEKPKDFMDLFN